MYNNPYNFYPFINQAANPIYGGLARAAKPSLFKSLTNIKWGSVLTNTQKTLNVINQAIPVYYQIKPIWQNVRSFGKIMSAFNETDNNTNNVNVNTNTSNLNTIKDIKKEDSSLPTFFID